MHESRRLRGGAIGPLCIFTWAVLQFSPVAAETLPSGRTTLGFYGTPGLLDMPTAKMMEDADISFNLGSFGSFARGTMAFQITPRLQGVFRYSAIDGYVNEGELYFDRGFDVSYQLMTGERGGPMVTVGLRDFGGTGVYAGEYVVATQDFGPVSATLGMGWGRLGSYNSFRNPISYIAESFRTRPSNTTQSGQGNVGDVDFGQWFKGPAALFGGVQYRYSDQLIFSAEYSSDAYTLEGEADEPYERNIPFNFGVTYQFANGIDATGAYMYGNTLGVALNYRLNPKAPPGPPSGRDETGPRVMPRQDAAILSNWNLPAEASDAPAAGRAAAPASVQAAAQRVLAAEGLTLVRFDLAPTSVTLQIRNDRYLAEAQGIGRAARALTGVLPPAVETITIVPVTRQGLTMSRVILKRSDLEELDHDFEGAWRSYARAEIEDAGADWPGPGPAALQSPLWYQLTLYTGTTLSNPDNFFAETGLSFDAAYTLLPGLQVSTQLRQPLLQGGSGETPTGTSSQATPVRSDAGLYDGDTDMELRELTLDYFFRPAENYYGRLSGGYLEQMYGGVVGEVLWKPVSGPLALGAELAFVRKRAPGDFFGFTDYETATGFASAYYDFGNGFFGQVDAGRYLAQDWGSTFTITREFDNGFRLGAYFTQTSMSAEEFGEGSFDKGIMFTLPVSWLFGNSSRRLYQDTYRPINGDGGARLDLSNRLYEQVRDGHANKLKGSWGRFWR